MRPTLLAFALALLPLTSHAATAEHAHAHGSLAPHEHGTARLDIALDGQTLAMNLDSPAVNLLGFEHAPASEADRAAIAKARAQLSAALQLFNLPSAAGCSIAQVDLQSPLFGNAAPAGAAAGHDDEDDEDGDHHAHSDVDGHFQFQCEHPEALQGLDLSRFFSTFPATHKVLVQAITAKGQAGHDATPDNSKVAF
jgi:hypothetical protein